LSGHSLNDPLLARFGEVRVLPEELSDSSTCGIPHTSIGTLERPKQTEHQRLGDIVSGVFTPVLTKRARRGRTVGKAFMARLRSATEWPERLRRLSPGSKKSRILRTRGTVMVKTCTGSKVIIHFAGSWLLRPRSNKRTTLSGAAKICFKSGCFICSVTAHKRPFVSLVILWPRTPNRAWGMDVTFSERHITATTET
jgi:hypothetical protein